MEHVSVLKNDVEKLLNLQPGQLVVDMTLGLGGHAMGMLEKIGKTGRLYAFEQDERNLAEAKKRLKKFEKQIVYFNDNFRYLKSRVTGQVDAILFDLGLSSPHVDDASRGFSFMKDGSLDMRFDPKAKLTAAEIVNTYAEEDLADIFFHYGEEKMARKIARIIVEQRKKELFNSTLQLAQFLEKLLPRAKKKGIHPATRVFQALRIAVNDELNVLKEALKGSVELLKIGGKIAIISYHSLEDRIVKQFFKDLLQPKSSLEESIYRNYADPYFKSLSKKPVIPTLEEIQINPRSRSAKLRVYEKIREL